ncbi:MAG: AraC family transcriptional regulator, partial [Burkholderiaceae bacterium]|nr:AraC family transcriptional regulator [Burkholderiaceae bacterium]
MVISGQFVKCRGNAMPKPNIVAVAFDHISPFHLSVPCMVFGDKHPKLPDIEFAVCSAEGRTLSTTGGFTIVLDRGLSALEDADTIIVPSWRDPHERPPENLLAALIAAHQRGAQIVGLCLGAYVLAEAGLLDGLRATTHWAYADDFSRRF